VINTKKFHLSKFHDYRPNINHKFIFGTETQHNLDKKVYKLPIEKQMEERLKRM